jgi:signal transduction histidine kinase
VAMPGAVEQVLDNLLRNAQRYAPGAPAVVSARALGPDDRPWPSSAQVRLTGPAVLLTVADSGPGIPPERVPTLFEPTIDHRRDVLTPRLGLWICRRLVRAHGGDLWLI